MPDAVRLNEFGQPIGEHLPGWTAPPEPPKATVRGRHCTVQPLAPADAPALWEAYQRDADGRNWTYLTNGPFTHFEPFERWIAESSVSRDPQFYTVHVHGGSSDVDQPGVAAGIAAYLRITPAMGVIEVGHIHFSPLLQHTPAATEAMYLMMRRVFELGYRRYEWKCDALNAPSRRAAERLGFSYEGVFRQAIVTKGRNRDTAWYACIDREWPVLEAAYQRWLAPQNFDEQGRQRESLSSLTEPILVARAQA
jgi:RimJ/RimL family protein N-acetyltransferase